MANNGDETMDTNIEYPGPGSAKVIAIGNFHKTLPHNDFGEVDPVAYTQFKDVAVLAGQYDTVPRGPVGGPYLVPVPTHGDGFNNPQAARSHDKLTGGAGEPYEMPPAPKVLSRSTAAEFAELQWMAILRDKPLVDFPTDADVGKAVNDVQNQFSSALAAKGPSKNN